MTYELFKKQGNHILNDSYRDILPGEPELSGILERDLSYHFYTHFHPYAGKLTERVIRGGTKELQSADTEYDVDSKTIPGSIVVSLEKNAQITVKEKHGFSLARNLRVTDENGTNIELSNNMQLHFEADATVALKLGNDDLRLSVVLLEGLEIKCEAGKTFELTQTQQAYVKDDAQHKTAVVLRADVNAKISDGRTVSIPTNTNLIIGAGVGIILHAQTRVKLLSSKRKPVDNFFNSDFFENGYQPNSTIVRRPYPVKDLDFSSNGAYSAYNWELFFHIPITIAIHLSKNHRFAEAQHWFHYIFDPTDDSDDPTPDRFWKVRAFHSADIKKAEEILINLVTKVDIDLWTDTVNSIDQWKDAPFRPHVIARYRHSAYMRKTVMAYLDNLIAWGDSLFRQDTGEAIDEALMLYVLAANILGTRPQPVPQKGSIRPQTYANLRKDLKPFGSVMRELEAAIGFDSVPFPEEDTEENTNRQMATVRNVAKALYFCVPRNDKMLGYWDTVADRLFKIRNSLNFQGVFRQLALFEPPIDPAMLARAVAAGLDISSIVNGLNQPLPLVRFQLLVQKATEIVQEVKSLGNSLLSAMEKEDGEAMAILRARHERVVMEMVEHVKYGQLQESIKSKEGLLASLALAIHKYTYYERQLGKDPKEIKIPELEELDKDSLDKMKFAMEEPSISIRDIEIDINDDLGSSGGKIISSFESQELNKLSHAQNLQNEANQLNSIAKALSLIPETAAKAQPVGVGVGIQFGGRALSTQLSLAADALKASAAGFTYQASTTKTIGSYARREQDWSFQSNLIAGEITQIFKQIRAAEIRKAIAELDLKNHRKQMEHAKEIEHFLNEEGVNRKGKQTNKALYTWMKREVKGLYGQCFQFAFDIAKKAERALQHELGKPDLNYLQFGYLSGKEGLLAGEKLYLDIKRMEMAYHEQNQREYELTKNISLLQLNPLALIQLRETGRCNLQLPESLFDMDGPSHFFRRIKTVALSIPCVTGPYASVNCTLTLLKSSIRKTPVLQEGQYERVDAEDSRFSDHFGSLQSIVTSSAQNDSGLFETNLHDERYLPFENSGVISEWQLELPGNPSKNDPCQFDYHTISDVILHMRYTGREGGNLLRGAAIEQNKALIENAKAAGTTRLFSVRHEFPSEWAKFKKQKIEGNQYKLEINFLSKHYPFWAQEYLQRVQHILFLVSGKKGNLKINIKKGKADCVKDKKYGDLLVGEFNAPSTLNPTGIWELLLSDKNINDLWITIGWGA